MADFFARKMKTYFNHHDLNNDGYLSLKEFVEMADRQSDAAKADDAQREELKGLFIKVGYMYFTIVLFTLVDDYNNYI